MILMTIPFVAPSLNQQKRMHWGAYRRLRARFAMEIWVHLGGKLAALQAKPFAKASIVVVRHGLRRLDFDNLVGAHKPLLDVLRPASTSNPNGLGIIADDTEDHIKVEYRQELAKKGQERTILSVRAAVA